MNKNSVSNFNMLKTFRNILLIFVIIYFIELTYGIFFDKSVARVTNTCHECGIQLIFTSILSYGLTILIFIMFLINNKISKSLEILLLVLNLYLYIKYLVNDCDNPICFLNPYAFPPIFISFIIIFHKTKYFNQAFILLILFPASLVMIDDIVSRITMSPSKERCLEDLKNAEYSPIYLPKKFFHKKNIDGKNYLQPNVITSIDLKENYEDTILFTKLCSFHEEYKIRKYLTDNIVLCFHKSFNKFTIVHFHDSKTLVLLKFTETFRKPNFLDRLLGTTDGYFSCSAKFSDKDMLNILPFENYLKPEQ